MTENGSGGSEESGPPLSQRARTLLESIEVSVDSVFGCVIPGDPISKARPRFSASGRPYTPQKTIDGEKRIAAGLAASVPKHTSNVGIVVMFYRSTFQRIDVDNMMKAVLDGGTRAGIWDDDSQVTAMVAIAEYDRENPRTEIIVGTHVSTLSRGDAAKATCEACGARYLPAGNKRRGASRWCSAACREYLAVPVPCPECKTPFRRKNGNHKFCSVECRGRAQRVEARCESCGKLLSKTKYKQCRACFQSQS